MRSLRRHHALFACAGVGTRSSVVEFGPQRVRAERAAHASGAGGVPVDPVDPRRRRRVHRARVHPADIEEGLLSTPEAPSPRRRALRAVLDPGSPALTIAGVFGVATGFLLIAFGWFEISGTVNVALQMPYLVSAAVTGLALIVIGVSLVAIAAKRQDADRRIRTLDRLETVLRDRAPQPPDADGRRPLSVRDSDVRAALVFASLAVAGLVAVVLAWFGVSGTLNVGAQVAYTVSGGIGGLALVISGAGLFFSHLGRMSAAREDASLERVVDAASQVADSGPSDGDRAGRVAARRGRGARRSK